MVIFRKKSIRYVVIVVVLIVTAIICIRVYKEIKENDVINYEKVFYENQNEFNKVAEELMLLDSQYLTFCMNSSELLAYDNGEAINMTEVSANKDISNNIKNIFKAINMLQYIYKLDGYVDFEFCDEYGPIHILYTYDKNRFNGFTDIEELGGNWYFWGVLMPEDGLY